jgi:hypothetical protein
MMHAYYAHELRRRGWKDVIVYLPHDGVATNNITGKRYRHSYQEYRSRCRDDAHRSGAARFSAMLV